MTRLTFMWHPRHLPIPRGWRIHKPKPHQRVAYHERYSVLLVRRACTSARQVKQ